MTNFKYQNSRTPTYASLNLSSIQLILPMNHVCIHPLKQFAIMPCPLCVIIYRLLIVDFFDHGGHG